MGFCFFRVMRAAFVSAGASRMPSDLYSHALPSKLFRRRPRLSGLKSRLDPVSSICADVASTTLKVLEKPGSSVPILNGVVGGVSAVLDTVAMGLQHRDGQGEMDKERRKREEDGDHVILLKLLIFIQ